MLLRYLFLITACWLGLACHCTATRARIGGNGRGGWVRRPIAQSGVFGGLIPGQEPHLLEFHGANCDHCEAMVPLIRKVRWMFNLKIKRFMVWEGTRAFHLMSVLDADTGCKGLPFFYNRRTRQTICGATTWENFKHWAMDRPCTTFLPPPKAEDEMLTIKKIKRNEKEPERFDKFKRT